MYFSVSVYVCMHCAMHIIKITNVLTNWTWIKAIINIYWHDNKINEHAIQSWLFTTVKIVIKKTSIFVVAAGETGRERERKR